MILVKQILQSKEKWRLESMGFFYDSSWNEPSSVYLSSMFWVIQHCCSYIYSMLFIKIALGILGQKTVDIEPYMAWVCTIYVNDLVVYTQNNKIYQHHRSIHIHTCTYIQISQHLTQTSFAILTSTISVGIELPQYELVPIPNPSIDQIINSNTPMPFSPSSQ